jgi:hypothetical protein
VKSVTWLGLFATIIGVNISNLVKFWNEASFWVRFFSVAALVAIVLLAARDIAQWWNSGLKHHKNVESVNRYMLELLKRGGSATIFAKNLSWVQGAPELRAFLESEAQQGRDICIFVPQLNALTAELATSGVKIKTYSTLDYDPGARFTLLNPGEAGSSLLAIGKGTFPNFYTEEFTDQTHSRVIAVVRDLLNILEKVRDEADA